MQTYDDFVKEQLSRGKSELYANKYALKRVGGYSEAYCYWYAFAYESSYKNGESSEYSTVYADRLAYEFEEEVGFELDAKDQIEAANFKVQAYMIAWDYFKGDLTTHSELLSYMSDAYQLYLIRSRQNLKVAKEDLYELVEKYFA